jgi:hypothetical protein
VATWNYDVRSKTCQTVAGIPLGAALGGVHARLIQVLGDLPEGIAADTLALNATHHSLRDLWRPA